MPDEAILRRPGPSDVPDYTTDLCAVSSPRRTRELFDATSCSGFGARAVGVPLRLLRVRQPDVRAGNRDPGAGARPLWPVRAIRRPDQALGIHGGPPARHQIRL